MIKCKKVLAAYKGALSQSIRQYLESTFMHLYNDATKENIEKFKNAVQNRYGGWNDVKGQQNYDSMMAIPNFLDVDSVDKGLFELQRLMTEREGWKRPDQLYGDEFYKTWLKRHLRGWKRMEYIYTMMELQTSMDYETARDHVLNLVEIDRADKAHEDVKCKLVLKEQKANAISKEALALGENKGFIYTDDTVTISRSEYAAMQAGYHLQMTCYGCGKLGHIMRDCPAVNQRVHQQESRYRQLPQAQQQTRLQLQQPQFQPAYPRQQQMRNSYRTMQPQTEQQSGVRKRDDFENNGAALFLHKKQKEVWPPRGTGKPYQANLIDAVGVNMEHERSHIGFGAGEENDYVPLSYYGGAGVIEGDGYDNASSFNEYSGDGQVLPDDYDNST